MYPSMNVINLIFGLLYFGLAIVTLLLWFGPSVTSAVQGLYCGPADLTRFLVTDKPERRWSVTIAFAIVCVLLPLVAQLGIFHQVATGELIVIQEADVESWWTRTTQVISVADWDDMTPIPLNSLDSVKTETGEFKPSQLVAYGNLRNGYLPGQDPGVRTEDWIRILPEHDPSSRSAILCSLDFTLIVGPIIFFIALFFVTILWGSLMLAFLALVGFAAAGDNAARGYWEAWEPGYSSFSVRVIPCVSG